MRNIGSVEKPLLFVLAYHSKEEFETIQGILDHWSNLVDMKSPFKILFPKTIGEKVNTDLDHSFLELHDDPNLSVRQNLNIEWYSIAKLISEEIECKCWFWWEPDCLPVKKDCFEKFLSYWKDDTQVLGYRVKDDKYGMYGKFNGSAMYSKNFWETIKSYIDPRMNYDHQFRADKKNQCVEVNAIYSLIHHEFNIILTPSLRYIHGIKDPLLFKRLLNMDPSLRYSPDWYRTIRYFFSRLKSNFTISQEVESNPLTAEYVHKLDELASGSKAIADAHN